MYATISESGNIRINMDYALCESVLKYTLLEMFYTMKIDDYDSRSFRTLCEGFAYEKISESVNAESIKKEIQSLEDEIKHTVELVEKEPLNKNIKDKKDALVNKLNAAKERLKRAESNN